MRWRWSSRNASLKEEGISLKELERVSQGSVVNLEKDVVKAEKGEREAREMMNKVKGNREAELRVIREVVKAKIKPFHGELTMAGPSCLRTSLPSRLSNSRRLPSVGLASLPRK